MPNISKWQRQLMTAVTMIVCLVLLGACDQTGPRPTSFPSLTPSLTRPRRTPFPTLAPSPTPAELPAFLDHLWPKPGAMEHQHSFTEFGASVSLATLKLDAIAESGETLTLNDLRERVEFLLDAQPVPVDIEIDPLTPEDPIIFGNFALDLGEHTATVRVRRTSGGLLEFSWTFTVVAEEPTMPGLPEGLAFVRPLPDSTITQQSYQGEQLVPSYYGFDDLRGGVCFGVLPRKIVQPGEFLDGPATSAKYDFIALDGAPPDPNAFIVKGYELFQ